MIRQDEKGRWSNRAEDVISLEPYDPRWAGQFETEHQLIRANPPASVSLVVEHIGSTAVEGLPAKPIIDILIESPRHGWPALIEALKGIDYIHWEDNPEPDREFLVKGMPPFGVRRTHHVHICEAGSPLCERVLFRDYLRENAGDRAAYAELKERLAAEYPDDREAYTRGKGELIAEIMDRARSWQKTTTGRKQLTSS